MPAYTLDDVLRVAEATCNTFYRDLHSAVTHGVREIGTGWDLTLIDWLDPRITKGFGLDVALSRALTMAWRVGGQNPPIPAHLLVGTAAGGVAVRELPLEEWHTTSRVTCSADGLSFENCYGSQIRKLRVSDGGDALGTMFGLDQDTVPGTLTLAIGHTSRDLFLQNLVETGSEPSTTILLLYSADRIAASVAGSPSLNLWRPHKPELEALNGSHITEPLSDILFRTEEDPWYNKGYREHLYASLSEQCAQQGRPLTGRMFLDILAESSPLRSYLTAVLCSNFPEVEQVFWCNGNEIWDKSSPTERFAMLVEGVNTTPPKPEHAETALP